MKRWFWEGVVEPVLCQITPACKEVTQLLSSSLDKPLPLWRRVQLRLHFVICDWCHRYGEQLKLLRTLLRHFHTHLPEEGAQLSAEAREKIAEKLAAEIRG